MIDEPAVLKDFLLTIQIPVAWVEMDLYGHVNNANYFRYFESARVRYFEEVEFYKEYEKSRIGGVLSKASCHYLVPITYPDTITVGARVTEICRELIRMEHFISSKSRGLCAVGESEIVIFDFRINKKTNVPDFLRNKIIQFEHKAFNS